MKKRSLILALLFFVAGLTYAQRTVTGTVTDDKGESLVGASVLVKGTTTGAVTDLDGKYSLNVPKGATTLTFSFTGFNTEDVALGASNVVDMKLSSGIALTETIVTGIGVATDKRKVPVDVQTVSARDLPPAPTASIDQALVGKIAGAQISSVNGSPGARVAILLRGINSLNRGTAPMIMMDGVELGSTDINAIDLNIIDKVEVIQGAAAASLYGAQGANGVIQLFTKKGKSGKINIDFSTGYTTSEYLNVGGLRKATLHGFDTDADNNVIGSGGKPITVDPATGQYNSNLTFASTNPNTLINKPYNANLKYYDHFQTFLRSAPTTNNSLSISGGKDNFDFLVSGSTNYQKSNLVDNGDYSRSNFTANIGVELAKGLRLRSITQVGYTKSTINDGGGRNTIYALFNTRPFADFTAKLPSGDYPAYLGDAQGVNGLNPFFINQYQTTDEQKIDLLQSFNLNYQPFKWLELDTKYGLNYTARDNNYLYADQSQNANVGDADATGNGGRFQSNFATNATGENNKYLSSRRYINSLTTATFRFDLSKFIKSSTLVGYDYRNRLDKSYVTYGLSVPDYQPYTTAQAAEQKVYRDRKTPFVTYGYIFSQHFDFGDFAGITGGFRSDYSSAFGSGSQAYTFPRGDVYFRPSSLDFWKNTSISNVLPEVKIRAAFGSAGIQPKPFDRYVTLNTTPIGTRNAFYLPDRQSNPNLDVEVSKETEIGADFIFKLGSGSFFNSLTFSPTYWTRTTDNAIWDVDNAPSTGVTSLKNNAFSLASNGYQFSLGLQVADKKDFNWRFTTNFGHQTSEISKISGPPIFLTSAAGSTSYSFQEGAKIGQIYGYVGLHSVDERDAAGKLYIAEANQGAYTVASNGWVVNKTTKAPYFTPNQYSFGDPNPKFNVSFINSLGFLKNKIMVNFQIDWVNGSHVYNQTKEWMYRDGIHSDYEQPFTMKTQFGNDTTGAWSAFYRGVYAERSRNGTKNYFYEDASFVRLRNVEVAFDLVSLFDIKGIRRLQLILSGRNLITITKYTGLDPEVNSSDVYTSDPLYNEDGGNSAWDRGTDHNTMPNLRQYSVGLKLGF
jgi:TonB-dependent starch-binding outer membrane protein SusC